MLVTDPLTVNSVPGDTQHFTIERKISVILNISQMAGRSSSNSSQFMCSIYELLKTVYNSYKVLLILDICII